MYRRVRRSTVARETLWLVRMRSGERAPASGLEGYLTRTFVHTEPPNPWLPSLWLAR